MAKVVSENLFDYALLNPAVGPDNSDELKIVTGYASHALASGHISILKSRNKVVNIDLIFGMAGVDRVDPVDHEGFISLHRHKEFSYAGEFNCRYVPRPTSIHSKVYVWCRHGKPVRAFTGSANYTNNGFKLSSRIETLTECDPQSAYDFFMEKRQISLLCQRVKKSDFVGKRTCPNVGQSKASVIQIEQDETSPFHGYPKIEVPLRNDNGDFGIESGLNWGLGADGMPRLQDKAKPDGGRRDPDEAYIRFPKKFDCGFFPQYVRVPRGKSATEAQIRFTVLTGDNQLFTCIRASGGYGKEIQTPQDNSELGRWFRQRLGIPNGTLITPQIMKSYGRETVTFYKLAEDQFYMDF